MRPRWFSAITLTILLAVSLTASATAGAAPSTTAGNPTKALSPASQSRLKTSCARVPGLITRVNAALVRLPTGPDTKGSIAWVKTRAQMASERKHDALAQALTDHANIMTQRLAQLPNQLALLQKAQTECAAAGEAT